MKKTIVEDDAFKGLHCSICKKPLDDEPRIVEDNNLVGKYLCMNCHYDRTGRFKRRGIDY